MAERTVVTKVENGVLYSDGVIKLLNCRASFPYLGEPRQNKDDAGNDKLNFEISALLSKVTHKAAKDLVKNEIQKLMKENEVKVEGGFWCLKDGDAVENAAKAAKVAAIAAGDDYEEYDPDLDESVKDHRGNFVLKASERNRPALYNRRGTLIVVKGLSKGRTDVVEMTESQIDDMFFGGCWVNVLVKIWYFAGKGKDGKAYPKRMLANLVGVQFVKDDAPFGNGRVSSEGMFEALEGDDAGGFDSADEDGGL